jgi:hypothetical protein
MKQVVDLDNIFGRILLLQLSERAPKPLSMVKVCYYSGSVEYGLSAILRQYLVPIHTFLSGLCGKSVLVESVLEAIQPVHVFIAGGIGR